MNNSVDVAAFAATLTRWPPAVPRVVVHIGATEQAIRVNYHEDVTEPCA